MKHPANLLIEQLERDEIPAQEIHELLDHKSILVRASALEAMARHARRDNVVADQFTDDLVVAACDPENRVSIMGTIGVTHVAVACLLRVGTPKAVTAAQHLIEEWPEPDRSDLMWFLKVEKLDTLLNQQGNH